MKRPAPIGPIRRLGLLLTAGSLSPLATGQTIPELPPEIVSAWQAAGGNALLIFRHDGTYHMAQDSPTGPGMERGRFAWDKATSAFSAVTVVDTNGEGGLSHPNGTTTLTITGNTLTYAVTGEGTFTFSRVVNTASAIVGSWFVPGENFTVTFLADGTYFQTEETSDPPFAHDGMERGTYTWNAATKILTASPTTDTNGDVGLSGIREGLTATISGNSMLIPDEDTTLELRRITQIPAPLNVGNDFEVDQFANYQQTSAANPSLLPVPVPPGGDSPFWGEAYIEPTVSGTGGTLTIASQAPRPFINNDGWGIGTEYSSRSALNAASAFPNGANYVFARTGGTATVSYPAGGSFPPAPKITGGGDHGAWSADGSYLLGGSQTLIWAPHTAYDSATLVTVLSVVDQESGEELLYENVIQGDITSYDFSDRLTPGSSYDVQLEHVRIAGSITAGSGPFAGKLGYALYNSNTRFTLVAPAESSEPPVIFQQPVSQLAEPGDHIILAVEASGSPAPTYQWLKDGVPLPGQTGNSLSILNYSAASDAGTYQVEITNAAGTVTSDDATLGPFVRVLGICRRQLAVQQTASITAIGGANFSVYVEGFGINTTFPSSNMRISRPDSSLVTLGFDVDRWSLDIDFASAAAMQTSYPNGNYQIRIGGDAVPLTVSSAPYPVQPVVTSSAGTWQAGKLQITAAQAAAGFSLTTNPSNGDGFLDLQIYDSEGEDIYGKVIAEAGSGQTLQASIPGGTLEAGQTYSVEVEFDEVTDTEDASAFSWATSPPGVTIAFALLSSTTFITIEVVADSTGTPYATWQSSFFNLTQLANPAISGDDADIDNDGVPNLLEYLFGSNPTLPSGNSPPTITKASGSSHLTVTYQRKLAATGVTQVVEHSTNLSSIWAPAIHGQNGVTIATSPLDAATEQVTVTIPSTTPNRFVRLKATR